MENSRKDLFCESARQLISENERKMQI